MTWTELTRRQHAREGAKYASDLTPHSPSNSLISLSRAYYFRYKSWC
jgi:hypothetical protein